MAPTTPDAPSSDTEIREEDIPAESRLLRAAYKQSGLTVADLAAASGLSVATLSIALSGIRYRDDGPRVAVPSDTTIFKLGSVLGIDPDALEALGRSRIADMLREIYTSGTRPATPTIPAEQEALIIAAARQTFVRQALSGFVTEDLRAELRRREASGAEDA